MSIFVNHGCLPFPIHYEALKEVGFRQGLAGIKKLKTNFPWPDCFSNLNIWDWRLLVYANGANFIPQNWHLKASIKQMLYTYTCACTFWVMVLLWSNVLSGKDVWGYFRPILYFVSKDARCQMNLKLTTAFLQTSTSMILLLACFCIII